MQIFFPFANQNANMAISSLVTLMHTQMAPTVGSVLLAGYFIKNMLVMVLYRFMFPNVCKLKLTIIIQYIYTFAALSIFYYIFSCNCT
jgi:hypothetical protein